MTTFLGYGIPRTWTLGWMLAAAITHSILFLALNVGALGILLPVTITPLAIIATTGLAIFITARARRLGLSQGPASFVTTTVVLLGAVGLLLIGARGEVLGNIGIVAIMAGGGGIGALVFWMIVRPDIHPLMPIRLPLHAPRLHAHTHTRGY